MKHRNDPRWHQNRSLPRALGTAWKTTYLLAMRCPVFRRRDSNSGFRTELENLTGDAKRKGTSGGPVRPKVVKRQPGADCSVVALSRSNTRGAKGAGHLVESNQSQLETGGTRWFRWKAAAFNGWHEPCDWRQSSTDL